MYVERFYRRWVDRSDLRQFRVRIRESDLFVLCDHLLEAKACSALASVRRDIEAFIAANPRFLTTLEPFPVCDPRASTVVRDMARATCAWKVGPMAAVAGAVAQHVGEALGQVSRNVIVENGGDIYARTRGDRPLRLALYAGEESPFSNRLAFEVDASAGIGVCTSSGRVGPSLSFGCADAVVALADSAAEADAAATSLANGIRSPDDVDQTVRKAEQSGRLRGVIACAGDRLGVWGDVELVPLEVPKLAAAGGAS